MRKAEYRVFYARLPMTLPWELDVVSLDVPRATLSDPLKAPECDTARALAEFAPDVLLVDIAWFDLRHILPLANTEVWLLLRWCHPETLRGPFNRVFNDAHYARIVGIEPILPFEVREHIEPVVVTNPEECLPAWLGLSARTDLQAFRRRIDDQTPRMRLAKDHVMRENGADTLVRWLAGRG